MRTVYFENNNIKKNALPSAHTHKHREKNSPSQKPYNYLSLNETYTRNCSHCFLIISNQHEFLFILSLFFLSTIHFLFDVCCVLLKLLALTMFECVLVSFLLCRVCKSLLCVCWIAESRKCVLKWERASAKCKNCI